MTPMHICYYILLVIALLVGGGAGTAQATPNFYVDAPDTLVFHAGPNQTGYNTIDIYNLGDTVNGPSITVLDSIMGSTHFTFYGAGTQRTDRTILSHGGLSIAFSGILSGTETATLIIENSSGTRQITLIGVPSLPEAPTVLSTPDTVLAGDSSCGFALLRNLDVQSITLTNVTHSSNYFSLEGNPSYPHTLTGDINFCFHAPLAHGWYVDSVTVYYTDYQSHTHTLQRVIQVFSDTTTPQFDCLTESYGWNHPIEVGDTMQQYISLGNHIGRTLTIDSITIVGPDSAYFTVAPIQLPRTLLNGSGMGFTVVFTPDNSHNGQNFYAFARVWVHGDSILCKELGLQLAGYTIRGADDTTSLSLNAPADPVTIQGDSGITTSHLLKFTNTTGNTLKVSSVSLSNNNRFWIDWQYPEPTFYLRDGESSYTVLNFRGDSATQSAYYDTLIIVAENALQAIRIPLVGVPNGVLGVNEPKRVPQLAITISPNPATTTVHIEAAGLTQASFEMYDLLGTIVERGTSLASWDLVRTPQMTAGTYFIRAVGRDASGVQRVISQKLVLK